MLSPCTFVLGKSPFYHRVPILLFFSKPDQEVMNYGHFSLQGSLIFISHIYTHKKAFPLEVNALKTSYRKLDWNCSMSINSQRLYRWQHRRNILLCDLVVHIHLSALFMWINFTNWLFSLWIHKRYNSKILSLVPQRIKNNWKHWLLLSVLNL